MPANPAPAYRIGTERLILRCWDPADAAALKTSIDESLAHLREWMRWADDEPEPLEAKIERLRGFRGRFDLDQDYVYAIFDPTETIVLGGSGLHTRAGEGAREIGYWIHADHINRGYATETAAALTKVAFAICEMRRVEIHCSPANPASASVPRKLGFVHEGTLRRRGPTKDGMPVDSMIWVMHDDDYPGSPVASATIEAFDAAGKRMPLP